MKNMGKKTPQQQETPWRAISCLYHIFVNNDYHIYNEPRRDKEHKFRSLRPTYFAFLR